MSNAELDEQLAATIIEAVNKAVAKAVPMAVSEAVPKAVAEALAKGGARGFGQMQVGALSLGIARDLTIPLFAPMPDDKYRAYPGATRGRVTLISQTTTSVTVRYIPDVLADGIITVICRYEPTS